eukprot:3758023-Prymnesium_polylepis.1
MCEALREPKLVLFLREPTARAYSSFYEGESVVGGVRDPDAFHTLATIEVAIVRECASTIEPTGDPPVDGAKAEPFRDCCLAAARRIGQHNYWPGCGCDHLWPWERLTEHRCHFDGDKRAAQVRMGIYEWALRRIFRYHRASQVLIARSEDLFADVE